MQRCRNQAIKWNFIHEAKRLTLGKNPRIPAKAPEVAVLNYRSWYMARVTLVGSELSALFESLPAEPILLVEREVDFPRIFAARFEEVVGVIKDGM